MSKRNFKTDRIEITEFAFNKIMSWSMALDEVCFLAFGIKNQITDAVRLSNISSAPRNYFDYSKYEMSQVKKKIKSLGLEVSCLGHSHPHRFHKQDGLSRQDWESLPKGSLQIVVFPIKCEIGVWRLQATYCDTFKSKIAMELV